MAATYGKAETINYEEKSVLETLNEMTGGRGPDVCIDAVGMEAHGMGVAGVYDKVKQSVRLETGPTPRAPRGHHGLPQGRHPVGGGRLRRHYRQDSDGRGL